MVQIYCNLEWKSICSLCFTWLFDQRQRSAGQLKGEETPLKAGDFALVNPAEKYQYRKKGDVPFKIICGVPKEFECSNSDYYSMITPRQSKLLIEGPDLADKAMTKWILVLLFYYQFPIDNTIDFQLYHIYPRCKGSC